MRRMFAVCGVVLSLLGSWHLAKEQAAADDGSSLLMVTVPAPNTVVAGSKFTFPVVATGGVQPCSWHLTEGRLPPGLKLHSHTGVISGVPATPGEYHFTVAVTDSSVPPRSAQLAVTITVTAGLIIDWKQYPEVNGSILSGSVVVSNQTGHSIDLTVIVVAVNSIGRATALGYQHFVMPAQQAEQVIPFGSGPGPETYVVHADAIGHRKSNPYIFRAHKQTSDSIQITEF